MTTLLILSGFYIIWLAALLTVAYTPRLFHNYTLFKAINSILFVVISVLAWRHSGMNMFTYWPLLAAFCLAAFGDIAIGVANNRHGAAGASHSISGMAGVGFFSIAHIFYLLFFTQFCPMEWYHFILPIIAMLAMLRITRHPSFHFSRHTRPAGIFYYMVVTLMFSVGLNVAVTCVTWSPLLSIRSQWLGIGCRRYPLPRLGSSHASPLLLHPPQVPPLGALRQSHYLLYWTAPAGTQSRTVSPQFIYLRLSAMGAVFFSSPPGAPTPLPLGPHLRFAPDDPRPLRGRSSPFSYQKKSAPHRDTLFYLG